MPVINKLNQIPPDLNYQDLGHLDVFMLDGGTHYLKLRLEDTRSYCLNLTTGELTNCCNNLADVKLIKRSATLEIS